MSGRKTPTGREDRRLRTPRVSIRCDAVLTEADGCTFDVMIVELSSDGFKLLSRQELAAGEVVTLRMKKQPPLRASILWTRGEEAGGCFLDPVTL